MSNKNAHKLARDLKKQFDGITRRAHKFTMTLELDVETENYEELNVACEFETALYLLPEIFEEEIMGAYARFAKAAVAKHKKDIDAFAAKVKAHAAEHGMTEEEFWSIMG